MWGLNEQEIDKIWTLQEDSRYKVVQVTLRHVYGQARLGQKPSVLCKHFTPPSS